MSDTAGLKRDVSWLMASCISAWCFKVLRDFMILCVHHDQHTSSQNDGRHGCAPDDDSLCANRIAELS